MNTQVTPPAPPVPPAPPAPPALTAEQSQQWEQMRTQLAGGDQSRATLLQSISSPDLLFEKLSAKPADPQPPSWADIQKMLAGDDPAAQQFFSKYADPSLFTKSVLSLQSKLSEGGRIRLPGENATPEDLAEYAKAMGIPESPDKWNITAAPAKGYEVTEADKGAVKSLTEELHAMVARGAKPEQLINFAVQKYYDVAAQNVIAIEERAADAAYEGEQQNRELWGDKYDQNIGWAIAGAKHFFPGSDEEFDVLMGTKLDTGHALFDHPVIQRIFAQVGMEHAEDPFFKAQSERNSGFDPNKRIAEIQSWRNGTAQQRKDYAAASAPGGELVKLQEGLARQGEQQTQRR